jgi:large subunit ribosomal protein L21
MTRQGTSASKGTPREALDDFKRIYGIGPAIERRLHSAGIRTFADLAALSAEAIAALLPNLSAQQITKQGWIPQARKLVPGKPKSHTGNDEPVISTSRQH